jgi:2-C-methyl-D-erythritol 4-phosphate cytidylyltransferase
MNQQEQYAIIVAGGTGTRMSMSLPKQFIEIGGKPILMHTLEAFHNYNPDITLILVLPSHQQSFWNDLVKRHAFSISHQVIDGGHSRFASVKNGLNAIPINKEGLVAIHDGVRPFVSPEMIGRSFEMAAQYGNAIASVDLKESIRRVSANGNEHVSRSEYQLIQTPQTFAISKIKQAFSQEEKDNFTDDASVLEAYGGRIYLYQGEYKNIKITTPDDLLWAKAFLAHLNQ